MVEAGARSATHSKTLPTVSKAPEDTRPERVPVGVAFRVTKSVFQSVVPLSDPLHFIGATMPCARRYDDMTGVKIR